MRLAGLDCDAKPVKPLPDDLVRRARARSNRREREGLGDRHCSERPTHGWGEPG